MRAIACKQVPGIPRPLAVELFIFLFHLIWKFTLPFLVANVLSDRKLIQTFG